MRWTLFCLLPVILTNLLCIPFVASSSTKKLAFNATGEFTVLQMTDLHYGETDTKDLFSISLTNYLLDFLKPDLTILTGDMVSGYEWDSTSTYY